MLHFFICLLALEHLTQNSFQHCNPVPNPGTSCVFADMPKHSQFTVRQRLLTELPGIHITGRKGEGSCQTTEAGEAINWLPILTQTANCGQPPTMGSGPPMQVSNTRCTKIQKRSFQRACKRALQHGMAWFRGQAYTVEQFPQTLINKCESVQSAAPTSHNWCSHKDQSQRLRVMQWNPGGLSQSSFLELKHWLSQQPIDIVVLSETKWSFNSCWSDAQWSYVHSATKEPRSGGVLIMIARSLGPTDSIGFHALEDGRLLHARLHQTKRAIDILAVYQHVDHKTTQSRKLRANLWAKLNDYVGQLPQRNQFICSGDSTQPCRALLLARAPAIFTGTGPEHVDHSMTTCITFWIS